MKYPAADKALKVSETRASEKLRSAEASASKYPGARRSHSESGEFVSTLPTLSPADVMRYIKGATSHEIRRKFPKFAAMPMLWTRSYFVSTAGNVSSETIKHYVETQKTRP